MYIVSLALKLRSHRGVMIQNTANMWDTHLLNRNHELSMNIIQIKSLKAGLEFGKAVQLKEDLRLNTPQMCYMLTGQDSIRKFTCLRYSQFIAQNTCMQLYLHICWPI